MKKLLKMTSIVLLVAMLAVLFAACGEGEPVKGPSVGTSAPTETQNTETDYKEVLTEKYLLKAPTAPITFSFQSYGDGTCMLSDYSINSASETIEHIDFPSVSPSGDKVINVNILGATEGGNVPQFMNANLYNDIMATLTENGATTQEILKIRGHYLLIDLESALKLESESRVEEARRKYLEKYPFAEIMSGYILSGATAAYDLEALSRIFTERVNYTQEDCINDYNEIIKRAISNEKVTETILQSIPKPYISKEGTPKTVTVPDGVVCIANLSVTSLQEIYLPDSLTTIGEKAFDGSKFESIELPSGVTHIGKYAFAHCTKLKSIVIPSDVELLPNWVLCGCDELERVTLPASLVLIADNAFYGCDKLKDLYYNGTVDEWKAVDNDPRRGVWDEDLSDFKVHCTNGILPY